MSSKERCPTTQHQRQGYPSTDTIAHEVGQTSRSDPLHRKKPNNSVHKSTSTEGPSKSSPSTAWTLHESARYQADTVKRGRAGYDVVWTAKDRKG